MARRKARAEVKVGLGIRFKFLFTGKLPKPKRKAKKRVSTDASKGRKRIPKSNVADYVSCSNVCDYIPPIDKIPRDIAEL